MKKLSIMLCASLFASAFAAGCKKDKKDGEGAAAATCEGVAAKIGAQMASKGQGDMSKIPPEAKAKIEEGMKKVPAAIAQVCKDDKWSQEALDCAAKAKDPKVDCEGKISDEQAEHMMTAAMGAMGMGDMMAGMDHSRDTVGVVGAGEGTAVGSGTGSGTAVAEEDGTMKPAAPGEYPATCQGVADRAKANIAEDLPPGAPSDFADKFATMLVAVCTEDKWTQDVIDCGVTAANPRQECRAKLTDEQGKRIDAEQERLGKEMMEAMAASGGGGGAGGGGDVAVGGSSGVKECDDLAAAAIKLSTCAKIDEATRKGFEDMVKGLEMMKMLPDDQKAAMGAQCAQGVTGLEQTAKAYGC